MSVLKTRNTSSGPWQPIASIKGEKGDTGPAGGNVTDAVKLALLQIAQDVWYLDDKGPTYIQNLQDALFPPADIVSITAVYTQSGAVYDTADIDDLKADLVVTANKTGGTTQTIAAANYTLFGELDVGTSTITVIYRGYVTTFDVAVTREPNGLVDGTYISRDAVDRVETGHTMTVSNNTIAGVDLATYEKVRVPLQHPIKFKAGDTIIFADTEPVATSTTTTVFDIKFNGPDAPMTISRGLNPWRNPKINETATITEDFTATGIYFGANVHQNSRTFTLQLTVNGEVIF